MSGNPPAPMGTTVELDPLSLAKNSSGVVFIVLMLLILAAVAVWFIAVLKLLQLRRWSEAQARFEEDCARAEGAEVLFEMARHHSDAPGARIVGALEKRRHVPASLEGVAKRALVEEQKRASSLMAALGSIGSAAPFIGLFGTVWGIMDAFLRIGREKSASLPVVAPAIGEALIATAVGLFAAIPAVIAYNAISKRVDDLLSEVESAALAWVAIVAREPHAGARAASATPAPPASTATAAAPTPHPAAVVLPVPTPPPSPVHAPTPHPTGTLIGAGSMPTTPHFPEPAESSGPLPLNQLRKPGPPFPGR